MVINKHINKIAILAVICILVSSAAIAQKITPEAYINKYHSIAVNEMLRSGIPASITLAQGMLESGNGNSSLATEGNNHFGIKCHKEWTGASMHLDDDAPNECFRKYDNPDESYIDHTDFLRTRSRYAFLFDLETTDYKGWAHGLKQAGYATNPQYAQKLIELIERYNLQRFDEKIDMNALEMNSGASKAKKRKPTDDFIIDLNTKHEVKYNNGVKYIEVKAGDSFESICEEFGMKKWEIYHYNDIPSGSSIKYHKYLYIQNKRNKAHASHKTHAMRENETLFAVAHKYGVKLKKLQKYNSLKKGEEPKTGEVIQLRPAKKNNAYCPYFMYVNIAKRITNLIFAPQKEWQAIGDENSDQTEVLTKFVLPLIGIGAGIVFIRQLWLPDVTLTKALRLASLAFGVMMLGIYGVYWMTQKLFGKKLSTIEPHHWFAFAAYASGIYCLAETVAMAFPVLGFVRIGALLSAYAAYQWGKSANMANVGNRIVIAIVTAAALMASGIIGAYIANWL